MGDPGTPDSHAGRGALAWGTDAGAGRDEEPRTLAEALGRLAIAEDTLRAIAAGEVDAFVISDGLDSRLFSLSTADRPYRKFVESMRDGAATLSPDGVILYANQRLADMVVRPRDTIVGSRLSAHVSGAVPTTLTGDGAAGSPGPTTLELSLRTSMGVDLPVLVGGAPLDVGGDRLTCLTFTDLSAQKIQEQRIAELSVAQGERMTQLQDAQAALTRQATHDGLTSLPNRALLVDRIDRALLQATRSGQCVAVLFVDLDHFKRTNDTLGHAAGDRVLRDVAAQLQAAVRPDDTVARIGGDEFVVLTAGAADHRVARHVAERMVDALAHGIDGSGRAGIPVSIGLTVSDAGRGNAEILLHEADTAMYQAKSLGGQRVAVFDAEVGHELARWADARDMIQLALDERRVTAHYQPIVEVSSGRAVGYEALARLRHPDGRILPPAAFIGVAETGGLIVPLGAQVLEIACRQAATWPTGGQVGPTVAVNLSGRQLERGDVHEVVGRILAETAMDPARLHVELTETAIIDLHPATLAQLDRVAELGVEIGLDDFGTGYASLTHLRRLPVRFVKIDQSFVQGLQTDRGDERIVAAVIDLAANLGLRSIAEGVETRAQMDRLRELGCDQAQGYLIARPMPAEDLPAEVWWPGAPLAANGART